jgi:hypothetical protein
MKIRKLTCFPVALGDDRTLIFFYEYCMSERARELRRRRKRSQKMQVFRRRLEKATASEKEVIAKKVRKMTTGAGDALKSLGLTKK